MATRSKKCPVCNKTDEVIPTLYGYPSEEARVRGQPKIKKAVPVPERLFVPRRGFEPLLPG